MIQPIGYYYLWRELYSKPIWLNSTAEQKVVLITLLGMANFNGKEWEWKGEKFKAEKGQMITSLESIAENCGKGITIQNVRTALVRFEKLGFLTNESTKTGRLITIENWEVYQAKEDAPNKATNKDLTKSQQRPNKDLTPREEIKKDKKDKKEINSTFTVPSTAEIKQYCIDRGNNVDPERFYNYYTANGWMVGRNKMKDWKAAVRTWEKNSKKENKDRKDDMPVEVTAEDEEYIKKIVGR